MALNSISKKEILDQLEKNHKVEVPKNLIENEIKSIPNNPNSSNENEKISKLVEKRISLRINFKRIR